MKLDSSSNTFKSGNSIYNNKSNKSNKPGNSTNHNKDNSRPRRLSISQNGQGETSLERFIDLSCNSQGSPIKIYSRAFGSSFKREKSG